MQSNYIITIKKSNRKSISIQCQQTNNQNELLIKAPLFVSKKVIEQFIHEKSNWITKQFNHYDNNKHLTFPTTFKAGTTLYFLGKPYQLEHHIHSQKKIFFNQNTLILTCPNNTSEPEKKQIVIKWYKQLAKDILIDRTLYYANLLNQTVNKIVIKQQKSRWGSCSTKKNINLNWLLIKTPLEIINYVTLHECCHLIHMNHSKDFWNLVQQHMPNYKDHQQWLQKFGSSILANH